MSAPTVVILAAGEGTRMRSSLPKVLHPLCGRPLVMWPLLAAHKAGAGRVIVVDNPNGQLRDQLAGSAEIAIQERPLGTGDAVAAASSLLDRESPVLVINGDMPLLTQEAIAKLVAAHQGAALTLATVDLSEPGMLGRVVRGEGGGLRRVVEAEDASEEELALTEINAGVYLFEGAALLDGLASLRPNNSQGELYLTDIVSYLRDRGGIVRAHPLDHPDLPVGVNDLVELAIVSRELQNRIQRTHQRAGVTLVDPASTWIDADVEIGCDTVIEPSTFLRGKTKIGSGARIGPLTSISDCELGDNVTVVQSHLVSARAEAGASIGPFSYLRPNTILREGARAGTFVEIKNSDIGPGAKVPHLSYVGDADVGAQTNLGASTITANYDGRNKHRTKIGERVRTSVDTTFVAPVTIGDDAYTGAGSVITEDVPAGALGIARARQNNIDGYSNRRSDGDD